MPTTSDNKNKTGAKADKPEADAPKEERRTVAGLDVSQIEDGLARKPGRQRLDTSKQTGDGWVLDYNKPPGEQIYALEDADPDTISPLAKQGVRARDLAMIHPSEDVYGDDDSVSTEAATSADTPTSDVTPSTGGNTGS